MMINISVHFGSNNSYTLEEKKTFWTSLSDSVNAESVLVQVLV
jgi:hypothetical protein